MKDLAPIDTKFTDAVHEAFLELEGEESLYLSKIMYEEYLLRSAFRLRLHNNPDAKNRPPDTKLILDLRTCEVFPDEDVIHIAITVEELHEDLRRKSEFSADVPRVSGEIIYLNVDDEPVPCAIKLDAPDLFRTQKTMNELVLELKSSGYIVFGPFFDLL